MCLECTFLLQTLAKVSKMDVAILIPGGSKG